MTSGDIFDVIVVGTGMAGSVVAGSCGDAGMRVLALELGTGIPAPQPPRSLVQRALGLGIADSGERWSEDVMLRRREGGKYRQTNCVIGVGPGGSGRVYGAALGRGARRDFEEDFQPSAWNGGSEAALPNAWPVAYDEFLEAYRRAERLLQPVGTRDPLDPEDDADLAPPPPLSAGHALMMERLKASGRHPFRMHTAIAYKPGCSECQGSACARDCKAHGFNRALEPALARQARITFTAGAAVQQIARRGDAGWDVCWTDRTGAVQSSSARHVVMAAGALNTPRLLEASAQIWNGATPDLVGRGLMFHANELLAVTVPDPAALYGPRKVIAFRDHYFDGPMPLAECQSMGLVLKPGMISQFLTSAAREAGVDFGNLGKLVMRPAAEVAARVLAGSELYFAPIQDLPYYDSRVTTVTGTDGVQRIGITYHPRPELVQRVKRFRELAREAFAPLPVRFALPAGEPNYGHPMGTCRMGSSPDHSVVDKNGEVWDQPGLFVADASAFPSSLGINPALTVAAHALRVADAIIGGTGKP
ncbi:GMC oxidoreductase [Erythrobacter colymbi]|uniref:GMC oxidoreductase n=1 Tax=Erythrobacter colymbi TaxID=1161202 RepID=UPI000A3ACEB0|nr:GMC family oxidoreductase [Erythrobacter colymbi]